MRGHVNDATLVCLRLTSLPTHLLSFDSSAAYYSEDNPDGGGIVSDTDLSDDDAKTIDEDNLGVEPPSAKKWKPIYKLNRKFKVEWAVKCLWAIMVLDRGGLMHMVKCQPCSKVGPKPYPMGPKWRTI